MTATGLALLVLTLPRPTARAAFAVPGLIAFEAATLALGTLLIASPRLGAPAHHHGALLGASAGVLFGVSDVAIKALTGVRRPLALSPWLFVAVIAGVLAFLASARGFQEGDAVPVIACTSTAANLTCIVGGILVFGDALAAGVLLVRPDRRVRARRRRRAGDAGGPRRRRRPPSARTWSRPHWRRRRHGVVGEPRRRDRGRARRARRARSATRIREEIPDFRRLPAETLARAIRGNVAPRADRAARSAPADATPSSSRRPRSAASAPSRA